MTSKEAKEIIIKERDSLKANPMVNVEDCLYEAFDVAIKTLETQSCEDCINREDILNAIETWDKFGVNAEQKLIRWQDHYVPYVHLDDVRNAIANMPSVQPTRPTARWIDIGDEGLVFKCSLCGIKKTIESHFCPNCGARMAESEV